MTSLRSGMGTRRPLICWGDTAVTSHPPRSSPQAPFCTLNSPLTMPTRGQGFRCAMKSIRQVSVFYPAGCSLSKTTQCQSLTCCLRISPVCFKQESSVSSACTNKAFTVWVEFMWVHRACKESRISVSLLTRLTNSSFHTGNTYLTSSFIYPPLLAAWASMCQIPPAWEVLIGFCQSEGRVPIGQRGAIDSPAIFITCGVEV